MERATFGPDRGDRTVKVNSSVAGLNKPDQRLETLPAESLSYTASDAADPAPFVTPLLVLTTSYKLGGVGGRLEFVTHIQNGRRKCENRLLSPQKAES